MKLPICLSILMTFFLSNHAYAQNPDQIVSSFFQKLGTSSTIATGALQKGSVQVKPSRELTPMLMFAKANWHSLSSQTQASVSPWFARPDNNIGSPPTGVNFYGSTQVISTVATTHFIFHYLNAATPAYSADPNRATTTFVNQLATEAETVWAQEIGTMGYNAPPSDGSLGGDAKYDIYLLNTGAVGIYGYVTSDSQPLTGNPYPNSLYSYMVLDNDFAKIQFGYNNPLTPAKVTLAHEFFHSIQSGYDYKEFPAFFESLSTWMEDKVYSTIKDNLQYIGEIFTDSNGNGQYDKGEPFTDRPRSSNSKRESGSQDYPELHLDSFGLTPNGLEQYGRFMWIRYLSDKRGDVLIRNILTATGVTGGNNTYAAIDAALQAAPYNTTLAAAFHEFGIWNIDINQYQNGVDYPIAWGDRLFNNGAINISSSSSPSLRCFPKKQKHLSTIYELVNAPNATYAFSTNGTAKVSALIQSSGPAYTIQPITLTGGQGTWSAPAGTTKVTFVISNTSPTDDTMTWQLTDGVTTPLPESTTVGCPGVSPAVTQSSRNGLGCMSVRFSPWMLLPFAGITLLLWTRKRSKHYL